jgi:hypothetical protein
LRYRKGTKFVFENLGNASATDAESARRKKEAQMSVVAAAGKADVKLAPVELEHELLSEELKRFLKNTDDNGAHEAAGVYRLVCDEFLAAIGRQYVDQVVHSDVRKFQVALQNLRMSQRAVKNQHTSCRHS